MYSPCCIFFVITARMGKLGSSAGIGIVTVSCGFESIPCKIYSTSATVCYVHHYVYRVWLEWFTEEIVPYQVVARDRIENFQGSKSHHRL